MKKIIALFISFIMLITLAACSSGEKPQSDENGKLKIVCTIFPLYDWVRQTVGQNKNVDITLLLDSGVDLHSYQSTAQDIIKISNCDVFVYVGGESEKWADDMLENTTNKDVSIIKLLDVIGDNAKIEEDIEGMQTDDDDGEEDEYDEHIWLSLKNAAACVKEISKVLSEKDDENANAYSANADAYIKSLNELDKKYSDAVLGKTKDTVIFADRYPFRYLFDDYGINAYAAFSGCSAESEASFETISFLSSKADELGIGVILTTEASDGKIASTVINNTESKDMQILSMDSLQSKTAKDIESGATYLGVMESNLDVFSKAIA